MVTETTTRHRVRLTNRNNGKTGYALQDGTRREFAIGQSMLIDMEELELLQKSNGGDYLLKNLFIVEDEEARDLLNIEAEPEYFYTEAEIRVLLESGTLEQLEDALNFAPDGVIEIIKQIAVETEVPDMRKRKLISEKTNFNIDNAIMIKTVMNTETAEPKTEEKATRKAAPITVEKTERKSKPVITVKSSK